MRAQPRSVRGGWQLERPVAPVSCAINTQGSRTRSSSVIGRSAKRSLSLASPKRHVAWRYDLIEVLRVGGWYARYWLGTASRGVDTDCVGGRSRVSRKSTRCLGAVLAACPHHEPWIPIQGRRRRGRQMRQPVWKGRVPRTLRGQRQGADRRHRDRLDKALLQSWDCSRYLYVGPGHDCRNGALSRDVSHHRRQWAVQACEWDVADDLCPPCAADGRLHDLRTRSGPLALEAERRHHGSCAGGAQKAGGMRVYLGGAWLRWVGRLSRARARAVVSQASASSQLSL